MRIKTPVKGTVEFHLFIEGAKFPTKVLKDADAAIILFDVTETWKVNKKALKKYLAHIEMKENNPDLSLYAFSHIGDERAKRELAEDGDLRTTLKVDKNVKYLHTL